MDGSRRAQNGTTSPANGPDDADFHLHLGQRYRRNSIVVGVIGLFLFGIAAGVVAFIMANRAEDHGVKATAGKVLAALDVVIGIVVLVIFAASTR